MTADYQSELALIREATKEFESLRLAYRAGTITDDQFLAARKIYEEAEKRFDVAFAKEQENGE